MIESARSRMKAKDSTAGPQGALNNNNNSVDKISDSELKNFSNKKHKLIKSK